MPLFSGVFTALFRNHSGKTPETDRKKWKHFPEKERNLFKFKGLDLVLLLKVRLVLINFLFQALYLFSGNPEN